MELESTRRRQSLSAGPRAILPEVTEMDQLEMEEAFKTFDGEQIGTIDAQDLKVAIRALGFPVDTPELRRLVARFARKHDGRIDMDGFCQIVTEKIKARDPDDEIKKTFALLDTEGTGRIGVKELETVAADLGMEIDEAELRAMVQEFAPDDQIEGGDQAYVTLREFKQIMRQTGFE